MALKQVCYSAENINDKYPKIKSKGGQMYMGLSNMLLLSSWLMEAGPGRFVGGCGSLKYVGCK